jgi:hypothetical protein
LEISSHFRLKRTRRFIEAFPITDDTSILDVGGDPAFWADLPFNPRITILNICQPASVLRQTDDIYYLLPIS